MGHPTVEVTLLFTDIEGSTALAHELADVYVDLLAQHNRIVRDAIGHYTGVEARNEGDAFFAAFDRAEEAVGAALQAQRALAAHEWVHGRPVRVRMGLHTGPVIRLLHDFAGLNVHLASRIASAAHGGQVVASQAVVDALHPLAFTWTQLGDHIVKDFPDPIRLYQLAADGLDASFPPLATIDARDHNLPAMVTSFVGRQDELADLRTLLSGNARLVTLTGPGGVGKTRLALEATWSVLNRYRAGAWFVDFAAVQDPAAIVDTIAGVLGARDRDELEAKLREGPALLVLDNLEHLLSGVVVVAELLAACPALVVLATSRERLRLQGESEVLLDGLARADGVDLFTKRALVTRRDFVSDARVAALCERVGDLPLAIELAAARIRTHSIDALIDAMDSMLDALGEGERDRPARHQGMRAAIAVSVDALTEAERGVFRAFSTFAGGATAEAIAAVCIPKADEVASLVDKSLLRETDGRFVMLEPIRQYAEERLAYDVPGEREQRVDAHSAHFLDLAERLEPDLVTARQREALDALSAEHANLRNAWERGGGDIPLRIAARLTRFWIHRGHPHEGRAVLVRALRAAPEADRGLRAKALTGVGNLALLQHDLDEARVNLNEAVALGDAGTAASARSLLGNVARVAGDYDAADRELAAALELSRAIADDLLVGLVRNNQGNVAFDRGDFEAALERWSEALALSEQAGDSSSHMRVLSNVGAAQRALGRFDNALGTLYRSLELAQANGDAAAQAAAMQNIAAVMTESSDGELTGENATTARALMLGAIDLFDSLGYRRELANALSYMPSVVDDLDEALQALARAKSLYAELGDTAEVARTESLRRMCEGLAAGGAAALVPEEADS